MARITIEDCLDHVENTFQLVLVASKRARQLANGAEAMVPWEDDKPTVVALREIAEGYITPAILEQQDPVVQDLLDITADVSPPPLHDTLLMARPMSRGD